MCFFKTGRVKISIKSEKIAKISICHSNETEKIEIAIAPIAPSANQIVVSENVNASIKKHKIITKTQIQVGSNENANMKKLYHEKTKRAVVFVA